MGQQAQDLEREVDSGQLSPRPRGAGGPVVRRHVHDPVLPLAVVGVGQADRPRGDQGVAERPDRALRIADGPVDLEVALAQESKGVLVPSQPDVQAVLLYATVAPTAAGTLAPQSPAALVHGDRLELLLPSGLAQSPRRGQTSHAPTQNGDLPAPPHPRVASVARARASSG